MAANSALKRLAQLGTNSWLLSAMERVQESTGPVRQRRGWFSPSNLSHPCDAFLAFSYLGAPSEQVIPARLRRIFDNGSARDEALKNDVKKAGVSLITKQEDRLVIIEHYKIKGELDDWVQHPLTGERFIVDYKTMNNDEWQKLKETKEDHAIQVHPYMYAKETYKALLVYENKNDQNIKILNANFIGNFWQRNIIERLERILQELDIGYVRRTPIPNDSQCPFYKICSIANIAKLKEESGLYDYSSAKAQEAI